MLFKVIVAGGRKFNDYHLLKERLDYYLQYKVRQGYEIVIISGGATGADSLGERYARERDYCVERYPAEWDKYGLSAGYRRNTEMAKVADALIAFWNGSSKGTKNMIDIAKQRNLQYKVVKY